MNWPPAFPKPPNDTASAPLPPSSPPPRADGLPSPTDVAARHPPRRRPPVVGFPGPDKGTGTGRPAHDRSGAYTVADGRQMFDSSVVRGRRIVSA